MKFETKITEKHEVEIPVPSFYRDNTCSDSITDLIGIIDEDTICKVWESESRTCVQNYDSKIDNGELVKAFKEWQPITEDEFLTIYQRALHSMSLTPELSKEETTAPAVN